jgi:hypothetical protein
MADADFGEDFRGVLDVHQNLARASGRTALGEALCRRLSTPRGGLFYDLDYGFDLRAFLSAAAPARGFIESQAAAECLKDERVLDAEPADVEFVGDSLTFRIVITDADGPFRLTVLANALTVQLLQENT